MSIPLDWSGQKIAEFLAAVSSFATAPAAAAGAVERVAESLDAEVVAIVSRGTALAVIGYPEGAVPVASSSRWPRAAARSSPSPARAAARPPWCRSSTPRAPTWSWRVLARTP
ncbi:hypothetical protein BJF90_16835 [Pseudonocardia sp. CNS-004]|nr:hypothetical protein BJF90_16835 [Pseudonocardia sp. CNS-004]